MRVTLLMWGDRVGVMYDHNGKSRHLSVLAPESFGQGEDMVSYHDGKCTTWLAKLGFTTLGTSGVREVESLMMSADIYDGTTNLMFTIDGTEYRIRGRGAEISVMP